jgi:hypothetical protein
MIHPTDSTSIACDYEYEIFVHLGNPERLARDTTYQEQPVDIFPTFLIFDNALNTVLLIQLLMLFQAYIVNKNNLYTIAIFNTGGILSTIA